MKNKSLFTAVILLGLGSYYFLQKLNILLFENQNTWPTILIILGAAFLISGHFEKDDNTILPGIILAGLGIHFHSHGDFTFWPDHPAAFLFIVGLGLLLRSLRTKTGYVQSISLLLIGAFLHFFQRIIESLSWIEQGVGLIETYWPLLLIIGGIYLLFIKRK
ncbi:LiaI-LiaF-like domain-containing protein [Metabacillus herbersteinensis]|uniref:LiaI-LiaF-like domain-containing protein n=1 Tax=Metabacillus herbersteinensis TaxID=283816 RepID=A0ABV6G9I3_9BACI